MSTVSGFKVAVCTIAFNAISLFFYQVTFFQDITPVEMFTESVLCNLVKKGLGAISTPSGPWFECCVKSYRTLSGVRYQIFDTCLV